MARKPSRKHVPLVRLLARGDPVGGDAVRPLPAVTAQRAGPSLRARHRHLPRDGQEGGSRFGRCSPRRCASKPRGAGAWRRSRSELSYLRRAVDHEGDMVESFTLAQMESARWFLGNSLRGFHPGSSARTSPRRKRANQRYRPQATFVRSAYRHPAAVLREGQLSGWRLESACGAAAKRRPPARASSPERHLTVTLATIRG